MENIITILQRLIVFFRIAISASCLSIGKSCRMHLPHTPSETAHMRVNAALLIAPIGQLSYNYRMINKVGYTRPASSTKRAKRTSSTSEANFASALESAEAAGETAATEATSSIGAVNSVGLLGIQQVSPDESKRTQAMKHGKVTLDVLERLRDGLLSGTLPISTLKNLERVVNQQRAETTDPLLNEVLDQIEVRAAVELAKLEKSGYRL